MAFKPPYAVLRSLVRWWRSQNVRGIIIGGIAASLLGRPRVTRDVDALVLLDQERWKAFLESGKRCGFVPLCGCRGANQASVKLPAHIF